MNRIGGVASFGYHDVTDDPASSGFQRPAAAPFKLTCASFGRHLDAIAQTRAPELIDAIDPAGPGQHVLLTFDDGGHRAYYLRRPFHREPDFGVTSVNYDFADLIARAVTPY